MIVNVSSVNLFNKCPRMWSYRVLGYSDPETLAREQGTLWHECCANEAPPPETAPGWMHAAWEAKEKWMLEHPDVQVMANELELSAPFQGSLLRGRLDRLIKWNGTYWHWQWKTAAASKNVGVYTRLISRSFHEHAYRFLAIHHGWTPYGGSFLAVARKLSDAALDRGESPLFVTPLPTSSNNAALLEDLATHIAAMAPWEAQILAGGALPPQNPEACGGFYGNSPCHFIDVCDGRVDLTALARRDVPVPVCQGPSPGGPGDVVPPAA
jgi:hypothetical protein